jgi:hypothetical protein
MQDGESHTNDLNLDVNLDKAFAQRVDLDQSRVDGSIEATKLGDQADITLRHRLVWIWADDTARYRSAGTNAVAK